MPVILCGGTGTRLWPLSRQYYPKQFIDLGDGRTLFGLTLSRALRFLPPTLTLSSPGLNNQSLEKGSVLQGRGPIIVCNEAYRFHIKSLLGHIESLGAIILEPEPRNTAPAIALAAFAPSEGGDDSPMLVMPSDHYISDDEIFVNAVLAALPWR